MSTILKKKFPFGFKVPAPIMVAVLLLAGMSVAKIQGAASLLGEQVTLTVRYQVSPQGGAPIDQVLYTSTFTVGAGAEVSSQPVSFTYLSGGFNQTISGNVSADVGANSMSVSFSGTQQPGGLLFVLSSVTDQSAAGIASATLSSSSGFQSGVNLAQSPSFSNSGNGSVTANLFLLGFQPGVSLSENVSFVLVTSPTVTTAGPTGVTASGATLNGSINANGVSTTATFEYGLTTSYGNSVAATPGTVTGSTTTNISATISGLIPGAVYHYRAVGKVSGGVGRGVDQTFTIAATSTVSVLGTPAWTNSGATYTNFTVPAGNNRVLVVAAAGENYLGDPTINLTGVTFNGSAMTLGIKKTDANFLVDGLYYVALGTSASATTANIVVSGSAATTVTSIGAMVFQNVNQATPLNSFQSAMTTNGANLPSSVTVASTSGDLVVDLLDIYDATTVFTRTMGAGQTAAFTGGDPVSFSGTEFYTSTLKLGAASVPMTWATSANELIQLGANIKQATVANVAPAITTQPTNLTVNTGSTATFNAAASGTPTPTMQWQVSTNGGTSFSNIVGATSSPLSFTASTTDNGSQYRAIFTNVAGSATNTPATLTVIGPATHFTVSAPANATAGTAFNFTVTALDQFNSTVTGYGGTVHFTSTDGAAVLAGNTTLTSGTGTFSATLKTSGTRTITATDTVSGSINGTSGNIAVAAAAATHFTVSAPANATAGTAFNFTITALDAFNNTATGYSGTAHFTSTDGAAVVPANSTLTSGAGTFSTTLKTSGNQTITATDTVSGSITGTSGSVSVGAGSATHFTVSAPANATAGTAFNFTVTALDAFNNTATGYSGTAHFTSTDGAAVLPGNATLTSGAGTFSATLKTSGTRTITATDTVSGSIAGTSSSVSVGAGAATHFTVGAPANANAGTAFNFTVTALDAFNNTATAYSDTAHFTSTDGTAVLPSNSTLTSGTGTFSATLKTSGNQTITATDTVSSSITGTSSNVAVAAATATHFSASAPANATAGTAFNFTVSALDAFNNTATAYSGTAHFTSTDGAAVLPGNTTLTSGVGTLSATLKTSGTRTITATDTVSASITGTSGSIAVSPATATHFAVNAPASATAGTAFNFTVTALDAFNNTATGYSGTAHFTSPDAAAILPGNVTLTSGAGTFSATLKTSGIQTITATDTVTGSTTGSSGNISVSPAAATHFAVSAPPNSIAGFAFNFLVTALDAFNNAATSYSGTVHFTSTDGAAVLPANATLFGGVGVFNATLTTSGTRTITATDTVTGSITGTSSSILVDAAAPSHFIVSAPANTIAGIPFNFTVTAQDQFNNTVTGYGGAAHFTSADVMATLPGDAGLVNGVGNFNATLRTSGIQAVTATDLGLPFVNGTSSNIVVAAANITHFTVNAPANAIAGFPFNLTVTAQDQFNNTVSGYGGLAHFSSTDATAILPPNVTLFNGTGSFNVVMTTAGTQTITATDAGLPFISGTSGNIVVAAGNANHFAISVPANATAGSAFNFTVAALDPFNNAATNYTGTAHFTSTDGTAVLPADSALTGGLSSFSATLIASGTQTITATDVGLPFINGTSSSIQVAATAATHFAVSAPANATAGTTFGFTVTAQDQFNNTATSYSGTAHFTGTDLAAILSADAALTNGVGTFSATLITAGAQTITATDAISSSINGTSGNIAVTAAAATHFTVSIPANATAGNAFNISVTALDQFNNLATGYAGTAHFTSTDAAATLPTDATLTSGAGIFSATLKTAGSQTITVTDTVSSSITGTSGSILVTAASVAHFAVSAPANATAGNAINFTIAAQDSFNNAVTSYSGTVHFTSTDAAAVLPANATLISGAGTFNATLKTSGTNTIAATDTVSSSINGTSGSISVAAAAATHFIAAAPANAVAGSAFNFTVTAQDQFNNTATGYSGTAHFTSTDGAAALPANATFTSGVGTFSATLKTAGTQTITATDTVSSSINGTSGNITLNPAAATHFTVSAPANATAGTAFNFTATALDAFNNTATSYSGTAHFTSPDGAAILPPNSTLTSGTGTFSATLRTAGSQTITATDTVSSSINGSSGSLNVSPAAATHFAVSAPANATAGTALNFIVTALDQFNNTATAYNGTAHFTSTDGAAVLPADATLTSGVGTFGVTLKTSGTQTITATDTVSSSINGTSGSIGVNPAAATHFTVSAPANATAGTAFNFVVTAQDQFNNTATSYSGTTHFTSTDGAAVLPADALLASGVGTFSATLKTSGTGTITATDTVTGSINGTSGNIAVSSAAATHLTVSAPANATAGAAVNVTATALDQFNNTATGYSGTAHFTSTDGAATLPADATLISGVGSFSATLKTAGIHNISATDTVLGSISGTSGNIVVSPGAATHFALNAPAIAKARIATNFTATALDAFNNTATSYTGTVHFASIDGLAILPGNTTLASGVQTFSLTMGTAGMQTVTATDTANSSVTGTSSAIDVLDLQIVVPPANQFALPGSNATFSVAVSGTAPFAYQWLTNNLNIPGATNSTLTVTNVTAQTTTNYQVIITNAWGSVTSSVVTLALSGVLSYNNTLQSGSANLNPITGLYEEQLNVTNVSGTVSGLRLLVSNLPSRVSLYHATGTNNGLPYNDFAVIMTNGQVGTFLLQFLNPFRLSFTNSVQVLALNAGSGTTTTTNTVAGIPISTVLIDNSIPGSPRFTLAFTSVVGRSYQVLYSDDQMQTWALADTLTANATWTIWTELLPPASNNRFFKVIVLP